MAGQIVGSAGGQLTLPVIEAPLLQQFDLAASQLPQLNNAMRNMGVRNGITLLHAQYIEKILEKDFDGDGKVTKGELELFYGPQSKMPLNTMEGLQISPTPEQSAEIMTRLISRDMKADANGDGIIDFDEMRSAATQSDTTPYFNAFSVIRLVDPAILQAFDTSGDRILSRDEFSAAIRKTFSAIDMDKNGVLSMEEMAPFRAPRPPGTF